jgi:ABC-type multidrug transport system ATPase subunit
VHPLIEVTNVSQTFGGVAGGADVRALAETSITVNRGELMCLIGPSG